MRSIFKRYLDKSHNQDTVTSQKSIVDLGVFTPSTGTASFTPSFKPPSQSSPIYVRSRRLESLEDVGYVVNEIREGNIVLLDISRLNNGDPQSRIELKRIIDHIRGETRAYSADMALVNDGCVIVAPSSVKL